MDKLARLICGNYENLGRLSDILGHLHKQITFYSTKSLESFQKPDEQVIINITPYYARVILELSLTALIGRIDPFRLLMVEKIQSDPQYSPEKKTESAIRWSGDILAPDKVKPLNSSLKLIDISRAILASHIEAVFWRPAFKLAGKQLDNHYYESKWITELFCDPTTGEERFQADNALSTHFTNDLQQLYSVLSKGVHQELLIASQGLDATIVNKASLGVFKYVSQLGLLSHFIPAIHAKIDQEESVKLVKQIEREVAL